MGTSRITTSLKFQTIYCVSGGRRYVNLKQLILAKLNCILDRWNMKRVKTWAFTLLTSFIVNDISRTCKSLLFSLKHVMDTECVCMCVRACVCVSVRLCVWNIRMREREIRCLVSNTLQLEMTWDNVSVSPEFPEGRQIHRKVHARKHTHTCEGLSLLQFNIMQWIHCHCYAFWQPWENNENIKIKINYKFYLCDRIEWTGFGMTITDTHASNWDVLNGVIILKQRGGRTHYGI